MMDMPEGAGTSSCPSHGTRRAFTQVALGLGAVSGHAPEACPPYSLDGVNSQGPSHVPQPT